MENHSYRLGKQWIGRWMAPFSLMGEFDMMGHDTVKMHILMMGWYAMNSCELTASITAIANAIACGRTVDEINLLGVTFTQLGDTLLTIATQRSICGGKKADA